MSACLISDHLVSQLIEIGQVASGSRSAWTPGRPGMAARGDPVVDLASPGSWECVALAAARERREQLV
jgi:hypothetical protein